MSTIDWNTLLFTNDEAILKSLNAGTATNIKKYNKVFVQPAGARSADSFGIFNTYIAKFRAWAAEHEFSDAVVEELQSYLNNSMNGVATSTPDWFKTLGFAISSSKDISGMTFPGITKKGIPQAVFEEEVKVAPVVAPKVVHKKRPAEVAQPVLQHLLTISPSILGTLSANDLEFLYLATDYVKTHYPNIKVGEFGATLHDAAKKIHITTHTENEIKGFAKAFISAIMNQFSGERKQQIDEYSTAIELERAKRSSTSAETEQKIEAAIEELTEKIAQVAIESPIIVTAAPVVTSPVPTAPQSLSDDLLSALQAREIIIDRNTSPFEVISILLNKLGEQSATYQTQIQQLNQDITNLQTQLASASKQISAVEALENQFKEERRNKAGEIEDLKSAILTLQKQVQEAKEDSANKSVIKSLQLQLEESKKLLNETTQTKAQLELNIKTLQAKVETAQPVFKRKCLSVLDKPASKEEFVKRSKCDAGDVCNISTGECVPDISTSNTITILDQKFVYNDEGKQQAYDFAVQMTKAFEKMEEEEVKEEVKEPIRAAPLAPTERKLKAPVSSELIQKYEDRTGFITKSNLQSRAQDTINRFARLGGASTLGQKYGHHLTKK